MNEKMSTGIQVTLGFLLGIVLNMLVVCAGLLLSVVLSNSRRFGELPLYVLVFIGAVQLIWQVPIILFLRWRKHKSLALGVILATSATALLNATCWGLLQAGKIKIAG